MTDPVPEEPEYLEDPEVKLKEWSEWVFAENETEARRECLILMKEYRVRLMGVQRVSRRSRRWYCQFRSYEE
ncbi:MAG: hypothetical protein AAGA60_27200 [Cyanobacteria bacterium P01_E01_bin.42]